MAFKLRDRVRESSVTTGTGPIALGGAAGGYQTFSAVMSIGDTCWYAIVLPGSAWETGIGTYSAASTLTRTTVLESSNAGAAVNFGSGTKDVMICQPASQAQPRFPSGTLMLFQQTNAPIYWTKQTTHNNKALRVVSGAASFAGTTPFTTVFGQTVVGSTTITTTTMPSHAHSDSEPGGPQSLQGGSTFPNGNIGAAGSNTGSIGGNGAHNHTISLTVQYVDLIIASKD